MVRTRHPFRRKRWFWPVILGAAIYYATGAAGAPEVLWPVFPHQDKAAHFLLFGHLATLLIRLRGDNRTGAGAFLFALSSASLFGLGIECRQFVSPRRAFEWADWAADTLGAFLAAHLYWKWTFYRNMLECEIFSRKTETKP